MGRIKKKNIEVNEADEVKQLAFNLIGLAGVDGIGFAKAAELHVLLGVNTIYDLYEACLNGKIATLKGWGETRQNKLKSSIELSALWFKSQCKKVERTRDQSVANNITASLASKQFMKEIAEEASKKITDE